jgi:hypothetical protein
VWAVAPPCRVRHAPGDTGRHSRVACRARPKGSAGQGGTGDGCGDALRGDDGSAALLYPLADDGGDGGSRGSERAEERRSSSAGRRSLDDACHRPLRGVRCRLSPVRVGGRGAADLRLAGDPVDGVRARNRRPSPGGAGCADTRGSGGDPARRDPAVRHALGRFAAGKRHRGAARDCRPRRGSPRRCDRAPLRGSRGSRARARGDSALGHSVDRSTPRHTTRCCSRDGGRRRPLGWCGSSARSGSVGMVAASGIASPGPGGGYGRGCRTDMGGCGFALSGCTASRGPGRRAGRCRACPRRPERDSRRHRGRPGYAADSPDARRDPATRCAGAHPRPRRSYRGHIRSDRARTSATRVRAGDLRGRLVPVDP